MSFIAKAINIFLAFYENQAEKFVKAKGISTNKTKTRIKIK